MCRSNGLNQVDLLNPQKRKYLKKNTGRKRRGQKNLDEHNAELKRKDLLQDRQHFKRRSNTFVMRLMQLLHRQHHRKNFPDCCLIDIISHLKSVVADTATCILIVKNTSLEEISERFMKKIIFCRYSRRTPTGNTLKVTSTDRPVTDFSEQSKSSASVQTDETTYSFLFIKSDLRTCNRFAHCIKAQQSQAYAQKVKLSNLKMMAQTVAYVQEHGSKQGRFRYCPFQCLCPKH